MITSRRSRAASVAAASLLAAGALLVAPTAAHAAVTDHGGATRNEGDMTAALRDSILASDAKNVILLIGDGMGDSEITVARNYEHGAAGEFPGIDALPLTGQYTTYSVNQGTGEPNYVPDSAATGSAWATGTKSYNNGVSVDYRGEAQTSLLELAKANGMKTGNVATSEIQDATPAVQYAHVDYRSCYAPSDMLATCPDQALENGGPGSISEQLLTTRPDLTLGGGSASFTEAALAGQWEGQTLFDQAEERGFQLVGDVDGLNSLTEASQAAPVLGLFSEGNLPVRWVGPEATVGGGDLDPVSCTENPARLDTGLSLASMTSKAIDLLDNENGFFLQVEGSSIDKRDHAADACGQIGETVDLDEAVAAALDFARTDGDTLVVVTADHAHTSQIVGSTPPGLSASLLTSDGEKMIVSYGTSEAGGSQQHTGAQVRIAGYGPGAANVAGLTDQTDLFFTASGALGVETDLAALSGDAQIAFEGEPVPGGTVRATVTGLEGDWQARAALADGEAGTAQDIISGATTFEVAVPEADGEYPLTITGEQTGAAVTATLTVAGDAVTVPPTEPAEQDSAGAIIPSGGDLASTGALVAPYLLLALGLLLAGVGTVVFRRRQRTA